MNEPLDTVEAARKPSFFFWCFWILDPTLLVWLGLTYFHFSGRFTAMGLWIHAVVWIPTTYVTVYLVALTIRRRWNLLWSLFIAIPVFFIGIASPNLGILAVTILSAPALLIVRIFLDPFGTELMTSIAALGGGSGGREIAALIVYGAPLSGFGFGWILGGLLGGGQMVVFEHRKAAAKSCFKANLFGFSVAGLALGGLGTFFVLADVNLETKLRWAVVPIAASFLPHLWLTWKQYSPSSKPIPSKMPEMAKLGVIFTAIIALNYLFSLGDRP